MFVISKRVPVQRGTLGDGGCFGIYKSGRPLTTEWRPDRRYGFHGTAIAAIRCFIESEDPELKGIPDYLIRKHWPSFRRNHSVKITFQR